MGNLNTVKLPKLDSFPFLIFQKGSTVIKISPSPCVVTLSAGVAAVGEERTGEETDAGRT